MLDGLRPDALSSSRTPNLERLRANGASTTARSVLPSITLPCHTSIFHSVPPTRHGITSNIFVPMARPVPGLIDILNQSGKVCGTVYNWEELRDISRPGALQHAHYIRTSEALEQGDAELCDHAMPLVISAAFDFLFVYLGTIDNAGHAYGWMSDEYLAQVAKVDGYVGKLYDALPDDGVMLVHADHGGHDRSHGTDMPEDMQIPWILAGQGVRKGYTIEREVTLLDSAPTIARLLSVPAPREWEGTPVDEAFLL
jgi:predicted AlkP superfamily pyrophosphatase or phosphodiesterase